jgi:hypothetical protein
VVKSIRLLFALLCLAILANASCGTKKVELLPPEWVITPTAPLFLNPKSQQVVQGTDFNLNIEVLPGKWGVSAGEVTLTFDPKALEVVSIKPGNLLGTKTLVGTEKVDSNAGTITYAVGKVGNTVTPGVRGVFATVRFKAKNTARGTLTVGIKGASLADEKFEGIPELKTQGATVIIEQP